MDNGDTDDKVMPDGLSDQFDKATGLAWTPLDNAGNHNDRLSTFTTANYLMPLLRSGKPDDRAVAIRALDSLIDCQYDCPGLPHHGGWRHEPSESAPELSKHWLDFDPNYREFIGVPFVCTLQDFEAVLPDDLVGRMDLALQRAADGGLARELTPDYSNIALLHAWFITSLGKRFGREDLLSYGLDLAESVYRLFRLHNCFDEYNSPTYSALDLDALNHWIERPPTQEFVEWGREIEYQLWLEIGQLYHAGLQNLCGPYDRAYYLDLHKDSGFHMLGSYVGLSSFINAAVKPGHRPFDVPDAPTSQVDRIPPQTRRHFESFQGERLIERVITDKPFRVATAWLSDDIMIGAQDASQTKLMWMQYHMATMHWRLPDGDVGCLRLIPTMSTDALAEPGRLSTWTYVWAGSGTSDINFTWDIQCPGLVPEAIGDEIWRLPGLDLAVKTNTRDRQVYTKEQGIAVSFSGNNRDAGTWLRFELVPQLTSNS